MRALVELLYCLALRHAQVVFFQNCRIDSYLSSDDWSARIRPNWSPDRESTRIAFKQSSYHRFAGRRRYS